MTEYEKRENGIDIIDPPVGPYSSVNAINEWIDKLKKMKKSRSRDIAINEAIAWRDKRPS